MLEIVNQLDGFDPRGNVKVLMATNRPDTLDPALLRPGRLDRKVEFGLPDLNGRMHIFRIHAKTMAIDKGIRYELLARLCPTTTGAEIRAVCSEVCDGRCARMCVCIHVCVIWPAVMCHTLPFCRLPGLTLSVSPSLSAGGYVCHPVAPQEHQRERFPRGHQQGGEGTKAVQQSTQVHDVQLMRQLHTS